MNADADGRKDDVYPAVLCDQSRSFAGAVRNAVRRPPPLPLPDNTKQRTTPAAASPPPAFPRPSWRSRDLLAARARATWASGVRHNLCLGLFLTPPPPPPLVPRPPAPPSPPLPSRPFHSKSVTMVKGDKARVKSSDVVTREYTIHLHKRLQGM
jgi:hypothetical protein